MSDKLSKEIYMWENMIDELDVRALLTWADRAAALEARVEGLEDFTRLVVEYAKTHDELGVGDERDWEAEALERDRKISEWLSLGEEALAEESEA